MISVEEARARILEGLTPTPPEVVPLATAWQRVTATQSLARVTQPPRDVSAMDGYAVQSRTSGLGASLRVVGEAPAGHPWEGTIGPHEALRLFTGSIVPDGADSILIQEDAEREGDRISVGEAVQLGRHIRRAGQDFHEGDVLMAAGRKLGARDIGLLAAANHPWISVHRRPRIAILATGDEIALPGEPIPPGGIVSSNAHALAALVQSCGGEPVVLPIAPDDAAAIAALGDAARGCDMLVTTGGASVGDHDLVASALAPRLKLNFWKIAMRPGKPLMHGRLDDIPMVGLPGNPVSSLICAILFVVPAIQRLSGLPATEQPLADAVLGAPLPANDIRADYLRATLSPGAADGVPIAHAFARQDSSMLRTLAAADALILRAPFAPAAAAGGRVQIIRLSSLGM